MKSMRCLLEKPFLLLAAFSLIFQALPAWSQGSPSSKAKPALYEFGAGYCFSCKEMEKVMAALKTSHSDQVEFRMVYVDKEKELFTQYKILMIPTQVFLDASGKEVERHIGPLTKEEVIQKLKELKFIVK
ncbi:MAG: thioredoxin domain-containing protein [Thermodesulfobacteriota bacterium]